MAPEVLVALITSSVGLALSVTSVPISYLMAKRAKRDQDLDLMGRYADPILWSVHDLRSRIRTILDEDFLTLYIVDPGDPQVTPGAVFMHQYARRHTLFVLAQYLGWVAVLRREVGFLDLGSHRRNRALMEHLSVIRRVLFAVDLDAVLHVPAGQQAAIGELMIERAGDGHAANRHCLGFAAFWSKLDNDHDFAAWFARIEEGLDAYICGSAGTSDRLTALNKHLTDLIDFLDPDMSRFPHRQRVESAYKS